MITPSTIYWLARLDALNALSMVAIILGTLFGLSCLLFYIFCIAYDESAEVCRSVSRCTKIFISLAVAGILGATLLPTTKELAAIIVVPRIANSETVQQLGDGIVNLAQEWMKELAPKKGEAK